MKFRLPALLVVLALVPVLSGGCYDGDDPGVPVGGAGGEFAIVIDAEIPTNGTTSDSSFALAGSVIDIGGDGLPSSLEWEVDGEASLAAQTGSFSVDQAGRWSGVVGLQGGLNVITLSVPDSQSRETLRVTYNPDYDFPGQVQITPDVVYVNEPRQVRVQVALTDDATDPDDVRLVRGDGAVVANLTDDGDLGNGDDIESDNVFSGLLELNETMAGNLEYRVAVGLTGGGDAHSEYSKVLVTERLSEEVLEEILEKQGDMQARIEAAAPGELEEEIDKVVEELNADPDVADAGKNEGGQGAWVVYEAGIAGVFYVPGEGSKRGPGDRAADDLPPGGEAFESDSYRCLARSQGATQSVAATAAAANPVGSNKVLAIAAQYFDWQENDDIPKMADTLMGGCFDVTYKKYTAKGTGSVEDFKNLGDYGTILISSHGDSFYNGVDSNWQDTFQWNGAFGQVVVHSNMAVTKANTLTYEDDLKTGRLVLWGSNYGILPTFVEEYSGTLPNSLVYMSICRGTWNSTLAKAFLRQGAGTFLGFDDYVSVPFCQETGTALLDTLLEPGKDLSDAFTPGTTDPYGSDHAEFKLFGAEDLSLATEALVDGSFESGNITQAWTVDGDARIITGLGESVPTEGERMAVISTGLGFTTSTGTLTQNICLCEGAETISFDWNFFSEEFLEYVGSQYQDAFTVSLTEVDNPGNTTTFLHETVDSLAGEVSSVTNSFDQGGVYATGWRNTTAAIPESLRGKTLELRFFATDVGDSIYDTAVLLDDIVIEGCEGE